LSPRLSAEAQVPRAESREPRAESGDGSDLTVYLLTMGPGDLVWEKFGHNAIAIEDRRTGETTAWNWGLFDFDQADFIPRLARGEMKYWMAGMDAQWMLRQYAAANRSVWVQELNLTPAQRLELLRFVRWNEQDAHKYYRYDYYADNCSTRARDVLDRVIGGQLRAATDTVNAGTTFRQETRRLVADDLPTYLGIMLALGRPADQPISVWDDMFLPMRMRDAVRGIQVRQPDGTVVPLVKSERQWFTAQRAPEPARAPGIRWGFAVTGLLLAALLLALAEGARRGVRGTRGVLAALGGVWCFAAGVAGVLLLYVRFGTGHVFMWSNANALLFTPLSLFLLWAFPRRARRRPGRVVVPVAALVVGLALAGTVVMLLPGIDQRSAELAMLALPVHLAILVAVIRLRPRTAALTAPVTAVSDSVSMAGVSSSWS
ncbi:MAG TPA: DUF4105 domain-containing protein, partial [Gemmatimonadaceae bacterium]|nr:DUF4105 domain-containing protein [Gemmatimonadaceae bacterium]